MAHMLRSKHFLKLVHHPVDRAAHFPASIRSTLESIRPCLMCQRYGLRSSGRVVFVTSGQRWASGFVQMKPDNTLKTAQSEWKKKKKKNSDINQKIHSDLLKVLNKRAVQLVFKREADHLHRSLVTNFSFIDFPLQDGTDTLSTFHIAQITSKMKNLSAATQLADTVPESSSLETRTVEDDWEKQFLNFDQRLQNVVHLQLETGVQGDGESLSTTGGDRFQGITHSEHNIHKGETVPQQTLSDFADTAIVKTVTSYLEKKIDSASQSGVSIERSVSQHPPAKTKHSSVIKPSHSVTVNANIVKTKKALPAKKRSVKTVDDILIDDNISVGNMHRDIVDDQNSSLLSKSQRSKLKKAKAKQEEMQMDIAKFNHNLNQDLLAYVDACCFAGLESMAENIVKSYHYGNILPYMDIELNPDNEIKLKIEIYNKIMHAFAKKGQLGHIWNMMSLVRKDGLTPNWQSYASVWECVGRQKHMDIAAAQNILQEMEKQELDIKEIFNKCSFVRDEAQVVLKAIQAVDPSYVANPPPPPPFPSGPLVDELREAPPPGQVVERNPYAGTLSKEKAQSLLQTQLKQELQGTVSVKSILKQPPPGPRNLEYRKKLSELKAEWRQQLLKSFQRKQRYLARKAKVEIQMGMYPYLKLLDPQDYVDCVMEEVEELASSSENYSPYKGHLWRSLGNRVYSKFILREKMRNKVPEKVAHVHQQYLNSFVDGENDLDLSSHRHLWHSSALSIPEGPSLDVPEKVWPNSVLMSIGKTLYEIIIYDLKVDTNILKANTTNRHMVTAFYTVFRSYGHKLWEEFKPHPVLVKLYKGAELNELRFNSTFLPMVVPPVPWISSRLGGYLMNSESFMRVSMQSQAQTEKLHAGTSRICSVLDSINIISACPWIINKPVLDIIIDIFNNKGDDSLDIPPPPSECPPLPKIRQDMTVTEKSVAHHQRQQLHARRAEMYSLWCHELYRLSIANKFRDDVFWFPHNLDFRGRTYPCPPHFNHIGNDVSRSILMFAKGKPLGPRGLDWMKIHLINLTGFKKRSPNKERLAYANEILSDILDSADNPLTGNKWWQKSEYPWQTLACCMEITNAVRSPDPEKYVCHLPIHQDGSCNGLQHYAALGRDQSGAQSVNLWPYDRPQDVYSDVCDLVERERQKDAEEGVEIAQILEGFVLRKVIKQTVMTTVYGVTRYGAKSQIYGQLKDIQDFPKSHVFNASSYLTEKTFQCLNEMFTATRSIQDWLTLSAQMISTVCEQPVEWETPIGLTVVQPYFKNNSLSRFGVKVQDNWTTVSKPNARKQKNGFPPNFIHSLDSTHMMLTALYCLRAGITFVSVHDCFWTHACDVEIMNRVCREQFVDLHKQPILEDLSRQLTDTFLKSEKNPGNSRAVSHKDLRSVLANVPARGDFDLEKVLDSTYFFS